MLAQIDETKEFINTQLNEARNRSVIGISKSWA